MVVVISLSYRCHNQARGHRTGSNHCGAEEYPREKQNETKVICTRIIADVHPSSLAWLPPPLENIISR